jgi:hypothetical protein
MTKAHQAYRERVAKRSILKSLLKLAADMRKPSWQYRVEFRNALGRVTQPSTPKEAFTAPLTPYGEALVKQADKFVCIGLERKAGVPEVTWEDSLDQETRKEAEEDVEYPLLDELNKLAQFYIPVDKGTWADLSLSTRYPGRLCTPTIRTEPDPPRPKNYWRDLARKSCENFTKLMS